MGISPYLSWVGGQTGKLLRQAWVLPVPITARTFPDALGRMIGLLLSDRPLGLKERSPYHGRDNVHAASYIWIAALWPARAKFFGAMAGIRLFFACATNSPRHMFRVCAPVTGAAYARGHIRLGQGSAEG
jgi:hypothetical protein